MKRLMMLMLLLMLGPGCGGALSSVGGALVGLASGAGVDYAEDKIAEKANWMGKRLTRTAPHARESPARF